MLKAISMRWMIEHPIAFPDMECCLIVLLGLFPSATPHKQFGKIVLDQRNIFMFKSQTPLIEIQSASIKELRFLIFTLLSREVSLEMKGRRQSRMIWRG